MYKALKLASINMWEMIVGKLFNNRKISQFNVII